MRIARKCLNNTLAHKRHCKCVPGFKGDAICPVADQCATHIQATLKKVSPRKEGFDPEDIQLPCQCLNIDFAFAGSISEDKNHCQDIEGTNGETSCWLMMQDKFSKMVHCDVRTSKAPPAQFVDDFLSTCAPVEATKTASSLIKERNFMTLHNC